jgi:hypothetical protein
MQLYGKTGYEFLPEQMSIGLCERCDDIHVRLFAQRGDKLPTIMINIQLADLDGIIAELIRARNDSNMRAAAPIITHGPPDLTQ